MNTIPPECFGCGVIEHEGFDVNLYRDQPLHRRWLCDGCANKHGITLMSPHKEWKPT